MTEKRDHYLASQAERRRQLSGATVAIIGAARSGIALAKLLRQAGADVLLSDARESVPETIELMTDGIRVELGKNSDDLLKADFLCVSPGVPLDIPVLQQAEKASLPVYGTLEVSSWFCDAPVIAITGSNGKTTTTSLIGEMCRSHFRKVIVGGNIGIPLAGEVMHNRDAEIAVLEVSSAQLETISFFHPGIAVFTNLSPNHLDRYGKYEAYVAAKMNMLKNMNATDIIIYNADDELLTAQLAKSAARQFPISLAPLSAGAWWEGEAIRIRWESHDCRIPAGDSTLKGKHNRYNMLTAACAAVVAGVPAANIPEVFRSFPGIEHRLESVATIDGVEYINDSKATSVKALSVALESFQQPLFLIAGGKDKGGDYSSLNPLLKAKVRGIALLGEAKARMKKAWEELLPVYPVLTLAAAVEIAAEKALPGDAVLLSPACSSFDMFDSYEQRGRIFKEIVLQMKNNGNRKPAGQPILS